MISMGSAAALKNLLANRPTDGNDSDASAGPLSQVRAGSYFRSY